MLHYTLTLMIAVLVYNHPFFASYWREATTLLKLAAWLKEFNEKLKQRSGKRSRVHFKKDMEKRIFREQFKFVSLWLCLDS
jgi:hypothetical protein